MLPVLIETIGISRRCKYCGNTWRPKKTLPTSHCTAPACRERAKIEADFRRVYARHGLFWRSRRAQLGLPADHVLGVSWFLEDGTKQVIKHSPDGKMILELVRVDPA